MFTPKQKARLDVLARGLKLESVVLFGSAARNRKSPRDIDLAVSGQRLTFTRYAKLVAFFEGVTGRPVDLVHLESGLSPRLVLEILRDGRPIWVTPQGGEAKLVELQDRLRSIACDELLAIPKTAKVQSVLNTQRRLSVA